MLARKKYSARVRGDNAIENRRDNRIDLFVARRRANGVECGQRSDISAGQTPSRGGHPEIDAVENRAGVHPRLSGLRPAIWGLVSEDRLAEVRDQLRSA